MKHKNCWNKEFQTFSREVYERDENGRIVRDENKKPIVKKTVKFEERVRGGIKASKNEIRFRKEIEKMTTEKPRAIKGLHEKEN